MRLIFHHTMQYLRISPLTFGKRNVQHQPCPATSIGLHLPSLQPGRATQSTSEKRLYGSKTESDWSESGENILEEVEIRSRPVHNTTVAVFLSKRGLMSV